MRVILPHRGPPYDMILLDCDSTLCRIEGLDELAERAGVADQLRPVTDAAMNGVMSFDTAYAERLALLSPDRDAVAWLAKRYRQTLLDDAAEFIGRLQNCGKAVHIVSGGIHQALAELAEPLGLPPDHIHAVRLNFDEHGNYTGYDQDSPLCRQQGKAVVCQSLIDDDINAVMIGDGITDFEATKAGVDFIGFGGVIRRSTIENAAPVYYCETQLCGLLSFLLSDEELKASG